MQFCSVSPYIHLPACRYSYTLFCLYMIGRDVLVTGRRVIGCGGLCTGWAGLQQAWGAANNAHLFGSSFLCLSFLQKKRLTSICLCSFAFLPFFASCLLDVWVWLVFCFSTSICIAPQTTTTTTIQSFDLCLYSAPPSLFLFIAQYLSIFSPNISCVSRHLPFWKKKKPRKSG